MKTYLVYSDASIPAGGARKKAPPPPVLGYVIYVVTSNGPKPVREQRITCANVPRNSAQCELLALALAVEDLTTRVAPVPGAAILRVDCESVAGVLSSQKPWAANGRKKIRDHLAGWEWGVSWVARGDNRAADRLTR